MLRANDVISFTRVVGPSAQHEHHWLGNEKGREKKKWAAVDPEAVLSNVRSLGRLCGIPGPDRWSVVLCWDVDFIEPLLW